MPARTIKADGAELPTGIANDAAAVLRSGGLVVFPTETVYGVACSAVVDRGVDALRMLKDRPGEPFTIHLAEPSEVERFADLTSPVQRRLLRKLMPGPVTFVVEVGDEEIEAKASALGLSAPARETVYHNNTVGLRCPDNDLARRIIAAVGDPVIASSANRRGKRPPVNAVAAAEAVGEGVELIVDGGACRFAKPSTVLQVHRDKGRAAVSVLRAGVYDERYVKKLAQWTVLLVCSGNTCRSPMAEGLAKSILARDLGVEQIELDAAGYRVQSAGTYAASGAPSTPEAQDEMKKIGIDLSGHRSRPLTAEMVRGADLVYCMTKSHWAQVLEIEPAARGYTHLLDPGGDIEDPIGSGLTGYQRCAELIRRRLEQRLKEHH